MADPVTILAIAGGITGIVGGGGGAVSVVRLWLQGRREKRQDIWDSYERQIESATARGDTDEANRLRREYEAQQEAWRAQQGFVSIAPRDISSAETVSAGDAAKAEKVSELLEQTKNLLPALLSANDYFLRGNAYFQQGEDEEALASYERALALQPDNPETLGNIALASYNNGAHEKALEYANTAVRVDPQHAHNHAILGEILRRLKHYDEALAEYSRSLELRPEHPFTLYNRACLYSIRQKPDEALEDLKHAIDSDEKYRGMARGDDDFANIRDDPRFKELVGEEDSSS